MTNLQINPRKFVQIVVLLTIGVVGLMRLHLAFTRAFDPDEFAYLHWTWLLFNGHIPYRDFFFYILPGFPWLLSPILWLAGDSTNFLIANRLFMVCIYGLCAGVVYKMTRDILRWIPAYAGMTVFVPLFATLIFLTFPVTIDKTIDIRPDMVMLLLFFGSIMIKNTFVSGGLLAISILMLPKIIFSIPALLYIRFFLAKTQGRTLENLGQWLVGSAIVALGLLGYLGVQHLIPQAITSLTHDSLAVTIGKGSFSPLLLLSPYPLIYLNEGGVSLPWAVNTGIWILGLAGLLFLFKMNRRWATFWSLFIGGNIVFVILFPVPYVQYLLPLSVAASVLGGFALSVIPGLTRNPVPNLRWIPAFAGMTIPILLLSSFFLQYRERVAPGSQNPEQLQVVRDVLNVIKPNETVYDMVGSYVFRPDGYYICCHPYAEFVDKLQAQGRALRLSLQESLIANNTKFLVMDRVGFVFWKSLDADKAFLLTNYLPMGNPAAPATPLSKLYSLGQSFRCQSGACVQNDMDGKPVASRSTNTLTIIAPEKYSISIEPNSSTISIDGKEIHHTQSLDLGTGIHRFTVSPNTLSFHLQLAR